MPSPLARPAVQALRSSRIREVANAGFGRDGVLAFWFGESDQPTPRFICDAAALALSEGRTFYSHNLGREDLRGALSDYLGRLHQRPLQLERLAITSSGVNALMLAAQAVIDPGDRVVVVDPIWPNVVEIPRILSAKVVTVSLEAREGRWSLDLDRLLAAITPGTRALILNSPGNPTGWIVRPEHRAAILEHCRRLGVWLIADDVYERLIFSPAASAASFLSIAENEDRLISVNSFSKAWRMTGWRLGWMVAPASLMPVMGTLLEYNTSCAPDFIQSAGLVALRDGEPSVSEFRAALQTERDRVLAGLKVHDRLDVCEPDGGLYVFFRVRGETDSVRFAKDLLETAGLGLAPGSAFGDQCEGWLRWCFAAQSHKNAEGLERLSRRLGRPAPYSQNDAGRPHLKSGQSFLF